jgi:predicted GNAT superfamily acetyltransferase
MSTYPVTARPAPRSQAPAAALRAAARAGVEIRTLSELADLEAVYALYDRIWRPDPANPPVTAELLRAMTHAGNYAAGAYRHGELVGACVGFFAAPPGAALHSHVAGVAPGARAGGVGFALKLHQRAWALEQGLREVTWTFDPLVRRNAHVNLVKLGARPREYLVDFYGELDDQVNAGQGSDRLLAAWDLASPAVARACDGHPDRPDAGAAEPVLSVSPDGTPQVRHSDAATVLVGIPADIEAVRRADPRLGRRWRLAVRDVLGGSLAASGVVTGFSPAGYLVDRRGS